MLEESQGNIEKSDHKADVTIGKIRKNLSRLNSDISQRQEEGRSSPRKSANTSMQDEEEELDDVPMPLVERSRHPSELRIQRVDSTSDDIVEDLKSAGLKRFKSTPPVSKGMTKVSYESGSENEQNMDFE